MADPDAQASLAAAAERYGALETAYCQDRWQEVLGQGSKLLDELGSSDDPLATALRLRVQLLMGHSYLHGLGDRDAAEDLYRLVLNTTGAEQALRRSAEEGLQACNRPAARALPGPEDETGPEAATEPATATEQATATGPEAETEPTAMEAGAVAPVSTTVAADRPEAGGRPEAENRPEPVAPELSAPTDTPAFLSAGASTDSPVHESAAPWLRDQPTTVTAAPLIPDVVEEPELLEVRRAEAPEEIELDPGVVSAAAAAAQLLAASATAEALAEAGANRPLSLGRQQRRAAEAGSAGTVPPAAADVEGAATRDRSEARLAEVVEVAEPATAVTAAETTDMATAPMAGTETAAAETDGPGTEDTWTAGMQTDAGGALGLEAPPLPEEEDELDPDLMRGLLQVALG